VSFLFLVTSIVHAQEPINIKEKHFTATSFDDFIENFPDYDKQIFFLNCTFTFTSGEYTETGVDATEIIIPSRYKTLHFGMCTFNNCGVEAQGDTFLSFWKCKTIKSINASRISVYEGCEVENIFHPEGQPISLGVKNSVVNQINLHKTIDKLIITNSTVNDITLHNVTMHSINCTNSSLYFEDNNADAVVTFLTNGDSVLNTQKGSNLPILDIGNYYGRIYPSKIFHNYCFVDVFLSNLDCNNLRFNNCRFEPKSVLPLYNSSVDYFSITNTHLGTLDLYGSSINNSLEFDNSVLLGLNLTKTNIQTNNISGLSFDQLQGMKLSVFNPVKLGLFTQQTKTVSKTDSLLVIHQRNEYIDEVLTPMYDTLHFSSITPYSGNNIGERDNDQLFHELSNNYAKLYSIYKDRQDIESANACYAEMKDLYTRRSRLQFYDDPSFRNFFRWQLSNFVRFYTNHGTDPALAITISFWTIFGFAVFYFFFPSDWDITSGSVLRQRFGDFIEKNEKGYVKPFIVFAGATSLKFLNALTLSLNAFTTLGFGNIPTHGAARYACVLQGFIGWFMLTIFSVALINQVLF
jgi:hypothetical protein